MRRLGIYIPLHVHSTFGSVGDSILKIDKYISKAKALGLPAVGLSDHGSLSQMFNFYYAAKNAGLKPIIGCEVYEVDNRLNKDKSDPQSKHYYHLLLIAKNNRGLKNLITIVNDSHINGFYYKPRTDLSFIAEHNEGLIATSACIGGRIPRLLLSGRYDEAKTMVEKYREIFEEFYLEIQPGSFDEQIEVNRALVKLSKETDTPLVATNDVHYLDKEDAVAHDAHVKINRKMKFDDDPVYPDDVYWFMSKQDLVEAFGNSIDNDIVEEAIENSVRIANICNVELESRVYMPAFYKDRKKETVVLYKRCFEKLESIKPLIDDPAAYMSRLLYELDTIDRLGFSGYFLMVADFIQSARERGIAVGPGRGSVAGSLVAYLLDITIADPIKYGLLFERFLSVHRTGLPDIDVDYDSENRNDMIRYAIEKYGFENCALVSTYQMRKSKQAIRDAARILGIDLDVADKAAKLIPSVYYDDDGEKVTDLSIGQSVEVVPKLAEMNEVYPELFSLAEKIADVPHATSIHAAGLLIAPVKLTDKIPLVRSNQEGVLATALELGDAERAGFVKFDFLSLASLSVYEKTQKDAGFRFSYTTNKFNDKKVWDLIGSKYTTGLFQISSNTYKARMPRLKPKSIKELANCLALIRGPCISSGDDEKYMEIVEGKREVEKIHPLYDEATKDTYGILIYQEQLMQVAVNFGFTLEESYNLMKAVAKKKVDKLKAFEEDFYSKGRALGVPEEAIDAIWQKILVSGQYAFNQAHAVSYALLSYTSAYLKTYHPKEFMANLLTNAYNRKKTDEIREALKDIRRMGFQFLPLDVNKSNWDFTIEDGKIRIGFCAVKGFGKKAYEELEQHRPFESVEDFVEKVNKSNCSKRSVIPGIFAGMFDSFGLSRKDAYLEYVELRGEEPEEEIRLQTKEIIRLDDDIEEYETAILGGQFLSDEANGLDPGSFHRTRVGGRFKTEGVVKEFRVTHDRNKKKMAFMTLASGDGHIECVLFNSTYKKCNVKNGDYVEISAKKDGPYSCVVNSVRAIGTEQVESAG